MDEPTLFPALLQVQPVSSTIGARPGFPFAPLVLGELLDAKVMASEGPGSFLIQVKGGLLRASSALGDLAPGAVLRVRVEESNGQTVLRVVQRPQAEPAGQPGPQTLAAPAPEEARLVEILKALLSSPDSLRAGLQRLTTSVTRATAARDLPPDAAAQFTTLLDRIAVSLERVTGPKLQEALVALGLQHEQALLKAADAPTLKGWLLRAIAAFPDAPWAEEAKTLLAGIERAQVLNALNTETGQPLALELPLCFGGASFVRLYVAEREHGRRSSADGERSFHVATVADLSGLGPVRVDAALTGHRLAARAQVADPEMAAAAAESLPELRQRLVELGFTVESLTTASADAATLNGEDLQQQAMPRLDLVNLHA